MRFRLWINIAFLLSLISLDVHSQGWSSPVVCWNVENYFDIYDNPDTSDDEFTPLGEKNWNKRRFEHKRNSIAKTIISVKDHYGDYPFLVGLVEVENSYVLKELLTDTPLSKLGYNYLHKDSHDPRGIECGLLYIEEKFAPIEVRNIEVERVYPDKPIRHILYTKGIEKGSGDTLHILVNHWSSKYGGAEKSAPNRNASALRVVRFVDSLSTSQDTPPKVIIMGDFNDTCGSGPMEILNLSKEPLINLSEGLAQEEKGTIKYKGVWELIDHFVVTTPLSQMCMDIFSPDFLLEDDTQYLSSKPFRTYSGPRYLGGVSDHLPIILYKK